MKKLLFVPLGLFLLLAIAIAVVLVRGRDPHEIPSPLINKPAPAFQLPQLHEPAKTLSAQDMRGKVWLLNFWGTWCIACREEHPWLLDYAKENAVPIVGIDYKYSSDNSDERAAAVQLLAQLGNPYSLTVYDDNGRVSIDYGVYGAPESFLIDKRGVIRFKQIGPITESVWRKSIVPLAKQLNNE
jgi:cytochrome c biogenesis protein CcmG, thiol:disulfide interchange protein DsbE